MADNGDMSVVGSALLDFSAKWMLPFVLAFVSWQYTEISKLGDRVAALQREAVTHAELQIVENRWGGLLDMKIKNLSEKQDITNGYLKTLIELRKPGQ